MHTWTETLARETAPSTTVHGWDHVTVTTGLGTGPVRGRHIALAVGGITVAVVAALGLGGVLSASDAASSGSAGSSGPAALHLHSRFGPVVKADPTSHSRLGPVVRHDAAPAAVTVAPTTTADAATTTTSHPRLGPVVRHWKS